MYRFTFAFALIACAYFPCVAAAESLYAAPSFYTGTSRSLSLGGAYTAVADGASFTSNHASFAAPSPWLDDFWSVSLTLQTSATAGIQDLDNDGASDGLATNQGLLGAAIRVGPVGFGGYVRTREVTLCPLETCASSQELVAISVATGGLSVAGAFFDGELMIAGGIHSSAGTLLAASLRRDYAGGFLGFDALYRPRGLPYRIGLSWRPEEHALLDRGEASQLHGRAIPQEIVKPSVLSLGFAAKLDEGREGFNVPRERDDDPTAVIDSTRVWHDIFRSRNEKPTGRWMATAQLDVTFPVKNALQVGYFLSGADPLRLGNRLMLTPRVGVEHVTLPGRLRLRAGSYLEPSPSPAGDARVHATAGFDLFLFHYLFDWGITGGGDFAPRLQQGSISFGIWG